MVHGAQVALLSIVFALLATPSGVFAQRGGSQSEGGGSRGGGGGGSSLGGGSLGGGSSSRGGSSLGGGSLLGGRSSNNNNGGGVTLGSNNGNGNNGNSNGNDNGNGNTVITGGQGNQVGGQGNQGGNGNTNQGGAGNNNQNQQGNDGSSQSNTGNANGCYVNGVFKRNCAGGKSDPIMTGFAGRSFNFFGDVGKTYSLLSEANHQFSMHLKAAQLHDHNGTNMDVLGLMYRNYRVEMGINAAEEVTVAVNDKLLTPRNLAQKHAWNFPDGKNVEMSWELHRPGLGNTVVFTTDTLEITSWFVPAGIPEPGHPDITLGSYLNFNISLLSTPVGNTMAGIIGETYERYTAGMAAISDPNNTRLYAANDGAWKGLHPIQEYEMKNLWDVKYPLTLFNTSNIAAPRERSALEEEVAFPVTARGCMHCGL